MSNENKSITTKAKSAIPLYIQNQLWYIFELANSNYEEIHYFELDIIKVESGNIMQKLVHKYTTHKKEYLYSDASPVKAIVVIASSLSSSGAIMMLGEEFVVPEGQ